MVKGFIVDTVDHSRLEFQHNPDEITDERGARYADIGVVGFSHTKKQFVSGDNRTLTFKLRFNVHEGNPEEEVKKKINWLHSLTYPEHAGNSLKTGARPALLVLGELYKDQVWLVKKVKARYFEKFGENDLLPHYADVDLVLEEFINMSVNYSNVRAA